VKEIEFPEKAPLTVWIGGINPPEDDEDEPDEVSEYSLTRYPPDPR